LQTAYFEQVHIESGLVSISVNLGLALITFGMLIIDGRLFGKGQTYGRAPIRIKPKEVSKEKGHLHLRRS
jgi:hypothetical protein